MRLAMRLLGLGVLAVSALAGCAGAASAPSPSPSPSPKPVAISIKGFAFNPATIAVPKGTTITWTNEDAVNHTVTTGTPPPAVAPAASGASPAPTPSLSKGDGRIDSGRIFATKTFAFTFNETGTFNYFCAVHPRMVATVTVQ